MAEGEGRNEGEDLFEDLDKFFAPIQDVDWPETTEPGRRPEGDQAPTEPTQPEEPEPEPTGSDVPPDEEAFEPPIHVERPESETDEQPEPRPTPGQEDLFEAEQGAARAWPEEDQDEEDEGVASFLFESEAGRYGEEEGEPEAVEEISEETFARAPGAYVDLPAPAEEPGEAVAELVEEVRLEPEPGAVEPPPTEEVQIAALLGEGTGEETGLEEPKVARPVRVGGEGLGGPSWQEPTAMEVGVDQERQGVRNVPMAFLTGLILAGLALGAIAIGSGPFAVLAGVVVLFAQGEFYLALQKRHYQPATALGLVAGALVLGAGYYRGESAILAIMGLTTFAAFLWYMTVPVQHRRNVVSNVALTVLGVAYIPMLAAYALTVLKLPDGRGLALSIIGLTFAYDTAAFAVGYFWGSRPLAPNISPKKSWEGAIGATLVVVAVAVGAVSPYVEILDTVGRSVGLAVVVAIFAPLGDLAESLLKRDLGIKDMGSILPGHGGVLDRIDSVLFVAPAAFLFLRLILL